MFSLEKCAFRNLFFPFLFNNSLQILFTQTKKKKKKKIVCRFFSSCDNFCGFCNPSTYVAQSSRPTSFNNKKKKKACYIPKVS